VNGSARVLRDEGDSRFYSVLRVTFGAVALGVASRYAIKLIADPDAGSPVHVIVLLAWTALAVLVLVGWHARSAAVAMALLGTLLVVVGDSFFSNHHMYLSTVTMALVAFSDCERHGALRPRAGLPDPWPRQLMRIQFSIVYLFAGLQKVNDDFLSGDVLRHCFERTTGPLAPLAGLFRDSALVVPMAFAVVGLEISLAVLVWSRRLRPLAFALLLPLQMGMLLVGLDSIDVYGIALFGMLMLALVMSFLDVPEEGRLVVWDDRCRFCRRWVSAARRFDVFHALRFVGSSSPEAYEGTGVTPQAAREAMQVVEPDGTVRSGFSALRSILSVLPPWFLVAPYLSLPMVRGLGSWLYRRAAAKRSCTYEGSPLPSPAPRSAIDSRVTD
jgi:predicted DCC family thiol-disulfide oxidoreductase YuxK